MRLLILLMALATVAAPAHAFRARNGLTAEQTGPAEITVPFRNAAADVAYWCAAGDFAIRQLGLANATRIWRASPPPRRRSQGITFTLDQSAATRPGMIILGDGDGSLSLGHTTAFCGRDSSFPSSGRR